MVFVHCFAQGGEEKYAPPILLCGALLWQVGFILMHAGNTHDVYGLCHGLFEWGFMLGCMISVLVILDGLVWVL
jgi:hypothetical protein